MRAVPSVSRLDPVPEAPKEVTTKRRPEGAIDTLFLINFVANWLAGIIGSFAESLGELSIFGGLAITLFIFAVVLWLLSVTLVRWMHGAEDVKHA